jgi:hypothetical protein
VVCWQVVEANIEPVFDPVDEVLFFLGFHLQDFSSFGQWFDEVAVVVFNELQLLIHFRDIIGYNALAILVLLDSFAEHQVIQTVGGNSEHRNACQYGLKHAIVAWMREEYFSFIMFEESLLGNEVHLHDVAVALEHGHDVFLVVLLIVVWQLDEEAVLCVLDGELKHGSESLVLVDEASPVWHDDDLIMSVDELGDILVEPEDVGQLDLALALGIDVLVVQGDGLGVQDALCARDEGEVSYSAWEQVVLVLLRNPAMEFVLHAVDELISEENARHEVLQLHGQGLVSLFSGVGWVQSEPERSEVVRL